MGVSRKNVLQLNQNRNLVKGDKHMFTREKMQEAEVSIRVAMFYIKRQLTKEDIVVSIDGAHIKTGETVHFDINSFTSKIGMIKVDGQYDRWQGTYEVEGYDTRITIHSQPGMGDILIKQLNGKMLNIESKKGNLCKTSKTTEYALMREAIGQLMTSENCTNNTDLAVAVPKSDKSYELASRWSKLEQIKAVNIKFLLVEESGDIVFL